MSQEIVNLTDRRLKTPRTAAIAGIIFSVLLSTSLILIWLSLPKGLLEPAWLEKQAPRFAFALGLIPYSGIAFLWFLGVIRDILGDFEDRFFSTVFFGSGLLFLAMTFGSSAIAGGILATYRIYPDLFSESIAYTLSRTVMSQITNIYGFRMAGVFMLSLGTIWVRTQIMPRWIVFLTYGLALFLLLLISLNLLMALVFPGWVFVVSVNILIRNHRAKATLEPDGQVI